MLHQIIIDSAVGILLVVGMIIAWNFPNPIGEHDTVKSKIGFNASFEFDILIASTIFYITSLVCHYWRPNNPINKVIHSIADTCVSTTVILVFIIATESLYLSASWSIDSVFSLSVLDVCICSSRSFSDNVDALKCGVRMRTSSEMLIRFTNSLTLS